MNKIDKIRESIVKVVGRHFGEYSAKNCIQDVQELFDTALTLQRDEILEKFQEFIDKRDAEYFKIDRNDPIFKQYKDQFAMETGKFYERVQFEQLIKSLKENE